MIARDLLLSLGAPALAVPAATAIGAWRRRTGVELDAETHAAASFALVLGWLQAGGMLLGTLGALRAPLVLAWIVAGVLAGVVVFFASGRRLELPALRPAHALLLVPVAVYLLMATVPPWDRDEMVYHLALPRQFALAGGYVRPDDNVFASLPLGWESALSLLYALGSRGEPLFNPRLLTAWTAAAGALATMGLARSLGARSAWIAGAALLAVPTFVEFGASGYVEPYQVLLVTLSLTCVVRVLGGAATSPAWLVPGAVLAGVAASVKYPGLTAAVLLALAVLLARTRQAVRQAAVFLAIALLVACPFYVRNVVQRHNPFFPLAFDLFGGRGWDAVRSEAYWETLRTYGDADGLLDTLALPLRLFLTRDMIHGMEGSLGPIVGLGFVASIILVRRRAEQPDGPATAAVMMFAGAYFLFWVLTVRQARFFLPAVPALLALLAAAVDLVAPAGPRAGAYGAVVTVASLAWGAPLYGALWTRQHTSAWLGGSLDRDALLAQLLPESYPALRELDALVPPTGRVWLVWTRGYTYYLDRPYRLDSVFEGWRFEALLDDAPDPVAVATSLRADGITHVLVNRRLFLQGDSADTAPGRTARLRQKFEAVLATGALVEEKHWKATTLFRLGP